MIKRYIVWIHRYKYSELYESNWKIIQIFKETFENKVIKLIKQERAHLAYIFYIFMWVIESDPP